MNPLDDFQLTGEPGFTLRLEFKNLAWRPDLPRPAPTSISGFVSTMRRQGLESLSEIRPSTESSLAVPQDSAAYLMVRITTSSREQPQWRKKVEVIVRNDFQNPTVVGIQREQ